MMASYLESALAKGLADPVQHNEELAHLYLRMALHAPGKLRVRSRQVQLLCACQQEQQTVQQLCS